MNDYAFGNFLYTLRSEKNLSQAELGAMLGVTNKAVSKWENGSAKPSTILLPRIAEIFDVSVEELFACKRFEKDDEYEKIKAYLSRQKRKYAILSSVFLSTTVTLPLFLIEFICIVMGFQLPDDIAGPLGAVGFIFAFIISVTALIIYRKGFKQALAPSESIPSTRFVKIIKNGIIFSSVAWWYIFALLLSVYLLILSYSSGFTSANIFLAIASFILISLFGVLVCFTSIKRLLKIKFSQASQKSKNRLQFSALPIWVKVCYITVIVLFPLILIHRLILPSLIKIISCILWLLSALVLVYYVTKKK